jgi:hypothetical protein
MVFYRISIWRRLLEVCFPRLRLERQARLRAEIIRLVRDAPDEEVFFR